LRRPGGSVPRMAATEPLEIVRAYVQAYDARDADGMLARVDDDCEIVTLHRGVMRGHAPLLAFLERQTYGVTMVPTTQRYFARGDTVVVHAVIEWRCVDSGEVAGRDDGATVFGVRDGRIARLEILDDLPSALASAGLTPADEQGES